MRFLELVRKSVVRRKLRSALTACGVAVAIATVVTLVGVSQGFRRSATESFQSHGVDMVVVRAGTVQRNASSLSEQLRRRLARLSGVGDVIPALTERVSLGKGGPLGIAVHGWPADSHVWDTLKIVQGRRPAEHDRGSVLVGSQLAHNLEKKVGDRMEIELTQFRVIGIYQSSNVFENSAAVLLLPDLQHLMDRMGQVSEFLIVLDRDLPDRRQATQQVQRHVEALTDQRGQPLGLAALPTEQYVNRNLEIRLAGDMSWATSTIALVIGSIGVLNTMLMSVMERTQEIGVLRAIGWRKSRIVRLIVYESCLVCLAGALAGIALSVGLVSSLSRLPSAQGLVRSDTSPAVIATGLAMAVAMGVIGAVYPAWRGAALQPTEALRYE
ncbi:MAG TPA: ABC transporter permease [Pirellulales bacterium]|jgi:putative ABC transport system permease protein|nr:ABC transporter permease [Pirellulales bacterium]